MHLLSAAWDASLRFLNAVNIRTAIASILAALSTVYGVLVALENRKVRRESDLLARDHQRMALLLHDKQVAHEATVAATFTPPEQKAVHPGKKTLIDMARTVLEEQGKAPPKLADNEDLKALHANLVAHVTATREHAEGIEQRAAEARNAHANALAAEVQLRALLNIPEPLDGGEAVPDEKPGNSPDEKPRVSSSPPHETTCGNPDCTAPEHQKVT